MFSVLSAGILVGNLASATSGKTVEVTCMDKGSSLEYLCGTAYCEWSSAARKEICTGPLCLEIREMKGDQLYACWEKEYFHDEDNDDSVQGLGGSVPGSGGSAPGEKTCTNTPPGTNTPLDPNNGGRSIDASALQTGDIILSTTSEPVSKGIRWASNSPVSHTILYVGDGLAIESVLNGVRLVPLETALANSNFAVAMRYPGLTDDQALKIRDFAGKQLDKKYDGWALFDQAKFRYNMLGLKLGQLVCPDVDPELFREAMAKINLGTETNDRWFCSELVLAAYAAAGVPLSSDLPHWSSPGEILNLQQSGDLEYIGHLKSPLSSANNLDSNVGSDPGFVDETNEEEQSQEDELREEIEDDVDECDLNPDDPWCASLRGE